MINENLEKLVQHARDKKPTDFKKILTDEIDSRIDARVTEIRGGLSKNMFTFDRLAENCEGHPDGVEHTHEDGTVHTHPGGDKEHTHEEESTEITEKKKDDDGYIPSHLGSNYDKKKDGRNAARKAKKDAKKKDEGTLPPALQKAIDAKKKGDDDEDDKDDKEKDEGTLPPALQKAIDAKKKNNSKSDDVDKTPEDDEDEDKKKDEDLSNFGGKKAKPFKKEKKEDIRDAAKRIMRKEASGGKEAYQKFFTSMLKKHGAKSPSDLSPEEKKKFYDEVDAGWEGDNESD